MIVVFFLDIYSILNEYQVDHRMHENLRKHMRWIVNTKQEQGMHLIFHINLIYSAARCEFK